MRLPLPGLYQLSARFVELTSRSLGRGCPAKAAKIQEQHFGTRAASTDPIQNKRSAHGNIVAVVSASFGEVSEQPANLLGTFVSVGAAS